MRIELETHMLRLTTVSTGFIDQKLFQKYLTLLVVSPRYLFDGFFVFLVMIIHRVIYMI